MDTEFIEVVATGSGNTLRVKVLSKHADRIVVLLGEGLHSVKCTLNPTSNGRAYAGSAMGREIVYERSPRQVQADLDAMNPRIGPTRRR